MREANLYLPLKQFLESQNYEVKREVHDCDVLAIRGEKDLSHSPDAPGAGRQGPILYRDVYGWFERVSVGVYRIIPRGEQELPLWQENRNV